MEIIDRLDEFCPFGDEIGASRLLVRTVVARAARADRKFSKCLLKVRAKIDLPQT